MAPSPLSPLFALGFETRYTLRSPPRIHRGPRFNFFFAPRAFFPNGSMEEEGEEEGKERRRSKGWWRDTFLRCNDALGGLGIPDRDACADRLRKKTWSKSRGKKRGGGSRSWLAPLSLSLSIFLGKMRSGERRISNFKGDVKSCECFFFLRKKRSLIYYKLGVL